jgi:hypothetical protein
VTDKQQDVLEAAAFENGIPVHEDGEVRVVAKGNDGAPERVAHANTGSGVDIEKNAGVVMPASDTPGRFPSDQQGRKG